MHAIKTTIHLRLPRATRWLDATPPALIAAVLLIVFAAGIAFVGRLRSADPPAVQAAQPTSVMIMVLSTPIPTQPPAPTIAPRMITAYDQPNGAVLGPIPEPSMRAIVARWGDAWLQTTWENAPVWILATDLGANLADVRPVPSVVIAQVGSPAAPEPVYQAASHLPSGIVLSEDARAAAFAAHNAQQLAWCGEQLTDYCAMVRAAAQP